MLGDRLAATTDEVVWVRADSPELDRWRSAVGPPIVERAERCAMPAAKEIVFAVWNQNVGVGDLPRLVSDLLEGRLSGESRAPEHAVLLLQEVHREGEAVPARPERRALGARRIGGQPRTGARVSIDAVARRFDLDLFYVPSMRNGRPGEEGPAEDRGNAILSTLPLTDWTAFELPFERQRRVAVAARVPVASGALTLASLHLDPRSGGLRAHRSFGAGRSHQARWLASRLDAEGPTLVGGDLNTWFRGRREEALALLRTRFPLAREGQRLPTRPLLRRWSLELDHVLLHVPWPSEHWALDDDYGSDHRPLVGRIELR